MQRHSRIISLLTALAIATAPLSTAVLTAPAHSRGDTPPLLTSKPAGAAAKKYTTIKFKRSTTARTDYGCFKVTLSGKARAEMYTHNSHPGQDPHFRMVGHRNPTIIAPKMAARKLKSCKKADVFGGKVHKMSMTQSYYGGKCSTNLSYSISVPWGVSVSAAPGCSETKIASRTTDYGKGGRFVQKNSGSPVSWKQKGKSYTWTSQKNTLCARAAARITVHKSPTKSDTTNVGFSQICWQPFPRL